MFVFTCHFICLLFLNLSINSSVYLSIYLYIYPSIYLCIYPSFNLFIYPSNYLSTLSLRHQLLRWISLLVSSAFAPLSALLKCHRCGIGACQYHLPLRVSLAFDVVTARRPLTAYCNKQQQQAGCATSASCGKDWAMCLPAVLCCAVPCLTGLESFCSMARLSCRLSSRHFPGSRLVSAF